MSVRIDAAAATQAVTRALPANNRAKPTGASAPAREADLTRQLEERLSTDIARIRQRVDSRDKTTSSAENTGRLVDIRA